MRPDQWAKTAKTGGNIIGVGNLILLILAEPTTLTLGLAVVLAPLTLAFAVKLTAFLACSSVSFALGDRRERAELLICAIGAVQPPSAGEHFREAMLAEIRFATSDQVRAIAHNLWSTALHIILTAWIQILRRPRKRAARW